MMASLSLGTLRNRIDTRPRPPIAIRKMTGTGCGISAICGPRAAASLEKKLVKRIRNLIRAVSDHMTLEDLLGGKGEHIESREN